MSKRTLAEMAEGAPTPTVAPPRVKWAGGSASTSPGPAAPPAPPPAAAGAPRPVLGAAAFHGPAGEYVRAVAPHTEADPAAVLAQLLVAFGAAAGRHRYVVADGSRHYPNENALVVGATSKARKGTSWNRVKPVLESAAPDWFAARVKAGLSSGEGVIYHVRDAAPARPAKANGKAADPDPGEPDKRLLCVESEFASVLDRAAREGNTLSAVLRQAWDGGRLSTLTKGDPTAATDAHVSVIGHITAEELLKKLSATEAANGFGNRILFFHAARDQDRLLPFGSDPPRDALDRAAAAFRAALAFAGAPGRVDFAPESRPLWAAMYEGPLARTRPGLAGSLCDRGEAHALRVALIYALLDKSDAIRPEHLRAAAAVWAYSEATVRRLFGQATGDKTADDINALLAAAGADGLTRNALADRLGGHITGDALTAALAVLVGQGRARSAKVSTGGRPAERWYETAAPDPWGAFGGTYPPLIPPLVAEIVPESHTSETLENPVNEVADAGPPSPLLPFPPYPPPRRFRTDDRSEEQR